MLRRSGDRQPERFLEVSEEDKGRHTGRCDWAAYRPLYTVKRKIRGGLRQQLHILLAKGHRDNSKVPVILS